jgi:hypothetical protein
MATIVLQSKIDGLLKITDIEAVKGDLIKQMQAIANRLFGTDNWSGGYALNYSGSANCNSYEIKDCSGSCLWVDYSDV